MKKVVNNKKYFDLYYHSVKMLVPCPHCFTYSYVGLQVISSGNMLCIRSRTDHGQKRAVTPIEEEEHSLLEGEKPEEKKDEGNI